MPQISISKPELIVLLVVPINPSRVYQILHIILNSFPCHLLFLYHSLMFIVSVIIMSTINMVADKWV